MIRRHKRKKPTEMGFLLVSEIVRNRPDQAFSGSSALW